MWDGRELYELLNRRGISEIEFTELSFEEFSRRKGDVVHDSIMHQIHATIMTKKHSQGWRDVLKEQSEEEGKRKIWQKRIELEEKKRIYWRCPNGLDFCPNQLTKKVDRERQGDYTPPWDLRTCSDCRDIDGHLKTGPRHFCIFYAGTRLVIIYLP